MTRWNKEHYDDPERQEMLDELFELVRNKKLQPPEHSLVSFCDYKEALRNAMPREGMLGKKQILVF